MSPFPVRSVAYAQLRRDESEPFAAPGSSLREAEGPGVLNRLREVV
jgi:hypothetical protein